MSEEVMCPICNTALPNRMRLGSHMWTAHKTKLKQYEAQQNAIYEAHSADGLMQPTIVKESKEFVNETKTQNDGLMAKPVTKKDTDIVTPAIKTENTVNVNHLLNEQVAVTVDRPVARQTRINVTPVVNKTPKTDPTYNRYRDLYADDGGEVFNEFLGR